MVCSASHMVLHFSSILLFCASFILADFAFAQCEHWAFESIVAGSAPAGAIDADRLPRACYSSGSTLKFGYRDGSGWHHELVQTTVMGQVSSRSVVMDSLDRFHVVYSGYDIALIYPWIRYSYRDEQGWHLSGVAGYVWVSGSPSLALDENMAPHVSYAAYGLWYWHIGASGAETETVDPASCSSNSIAFSSNDQPCICYVNEDAGELRYAWRGPIGWQFEVVDWGGADLSGCRLVHDANGQPHVGYYDETNQTLRYATRLFGQWSIETVDDSGNVGDDCSLALDAAGWPHISYYDATNGDLKYAFKNEGGWQITRVDTAGDVGQSTTIRLDEYGNAYFFYYDASNGMIKWAYPALSVSTSLENGTLTLDWSTVGGVEECWFYGAENEPWFEPDLEWPFENRLDVLDGEVTQYSTTAGIGNAESNWTYLIIAVDDQYHELARSNRVGEWDWEMNLESRISDRECRRPGMME